MLVRITFFKTICIFLLITNTISMDGFTQAINGNEIEAIPITNLSNGTYFLQMSTQDGPVIQKLTIIK